MMRDFSIQEFKPTILFLVKFVGIYVVGNFLYGLFVTAYEPRPDPVTQLASQHTALSLTACGWETLTQDHPRKPTTRLVHQKRNVVAIYEGCNGVNVMIIFVAFLMAFGPWTQNMAWFIPVGLLIIHVVNLLRIGLLFLVAIYREDYLYFTHKYFFTAILYVVVFCLWVWWVRSFTSRKQVTA